MGLERYSLASRQFLGATVTLQETYEWGWQQLLSIEAEVHEVAARIAPGLGPKGAAAILDPGPESPDAWPRRLASLDAERFRPRVGGFGPQPV